MSGKTTPSYKKRCTAILHAGVTDTSSQQGIEFCTESCPYNYCVIFEHQEHSYKKEERRTVARELKKHKVSKGDIALILDVRISTVERYLRR